MCQSIFPPAVGQNLQQVIKQFPLGLSYPDFCHRALSEEALSHNPVEESGEGSVIVMDSPWGRPTGGGFRAVAFDCPPVHLATHIAQKLPDLPLGEEPSIIGPAFPPRVPDEAAEDAFVVGYRVGATALHLMAEEIPFDQRPEGCPWQCLEFGVQCHGSIANPPREDHVRSSLFVQI